MSTLAIHLPDKPMDDNMVIFGEDRASMLRLVGTMLNHETHYESVHSRYIDPSGYLTPTIHALNGTVVTVDDSMCINPFAITTQYAPFSNVNIEEIKRRRDVLYVGQAEFYGERYIAIFPILQKISESMEFFDLLCRREGGDGLTSKEIFYLEDALTHVYKGISASMKQSPTFCDIHTFLEVQYGREAEVSRLLATIRPFLREGKFPYFDGQTNWGSDIAVDALAARIVSFDLSKLEEKTVRPIAYHVLLRFLKENFIEDKNGACFNKRIYAGQFCQVAHNDFTVQLVEELSSMTDTHNASIRILSTKWKEFLRSSNAKRLIGNFPSTFSPESPGILNVLRPTELSVLRSEW